MRDFFVSIGVCFAVMLAPLSCARFQPRTQQANAVAARQIRASQLLQVRVVSEEGDNLGKLQDLIVDMRTGRIESALVSKGFLVRQGSVAGLGEILMPVPWGAIAVGTERRFVLSVNEDRAATDPKGEKGGVREPGFAVHIFGLMRAEPPSAVGGPGDDEVESGRGRGHGEPFDEERAGPRSREL
jgi:sporulation protein YlmC with PRC-barrel domain